MRHVSLLLSTQCLKNKNHRTPRRVYRTLPLSPNSSNLCIAFVLPSSVMMTILVAGATTRISSPSCNFVGIITFSPPLSIVLYITKV